MIPRFASEDDFFIRTTPLTKFVDSQLFCSRRFNLAESKISSGKTKNQLLLYTDL